MFSVRHSSQAARLFRPSAPSAVIVRHPNGSSGTAPPIGPESPFKSAKTGQVPQITGSVILTGKDTNSRRLRRAGLDCTAKTCGSECSAFAMAYDVISWRDARKSRKRRALDWICTSPIPGLPAAFERRNEISNKISPTPTEWLDVSHAGHSAQTAWSVLPHSRSVKL